MVRLLLAVPELRLNPREPATGHSALSLALSLGRTEVLEALLTLRVHDIDPTAVPGAEGKPKKASKAAREAAAAAAAPGGDSPWRVAEEYARSLAQEQPAVLGCLRKALAKAVLAGAPPLPTLEAEEGA